MQNGLQDCMLWHFICASVHDDSMPVIVLPKAPPSSMGNTAICPALRMVRQSVFKHDCKKCADTWHGDADYQDTIELGSHKSQSRFLSCLCKGLMLHLQAAKCQDVTAQEAG